MTGSGRVVVDLRGLDDPAGSGAATGLEIVLALERLHPDLVRGYIVDHALPASAPPSVHALVDSGRAVPARRAADLATGATCFFSTAPLRPDASLADVWPPVVEHAGMRFVALVERAPSLRPMTDRYVALRWAGRRNVLRLADALLALSDAVAESLVDDLALPAGRVSPLSSAETGADRSPEVMADAAARALSRLAELPARRWSFPGGVAIVSPFPPVESGTATYSARLVEALRPLVGAGGSDQYAVCCFADGLDRLPQPAGARIGPRCFDARGFRRVEATLGGFEHVVYVLGNSPYHTAALTALRHRPAVVMAHDVDLSNLMRFSVWRLGAVPGGLETAVQRSYGDRVPEGVGRGNELSETEVERFGLYFFGEVAELASRVLVNSEAARRLALSDGDGCLEERIGVLPFAIALEEDDLAEVEVGRQAAGDGPPLVSAFGIVDPTKRPELLVQAVASLAGTGRELRLAFVGPVSDWLRGEITGLAERLGIGGRVTVAGAVERPDYLRALGRTRLAVQLRRAFRGEASAATGDCLAAGLPTIVSDVGWLGELPDDAVEKMGVGDGAEELAALIGTLLDDAARSRRLGETAARLAAGRTYRTVATALLEELRRAAETA